MVTSKKIEISEEEFIDLSVAAINLFVARNRMGKVVNSILVHFCSDLCMEMFKSRFNVDGIDEKEIIGDLDVCE